MRKALTAVLLTAGLASLAAAQAPELPGAEVRGGDVQVTWTWEPSEPSVPQGGLFALTMMGEVRVANATCAQEGTANITLRLQPPPTPEARGLAMVPQEASVQVSVPAGAHLTAPFDTAIEVPLVLLAAPETKPGDHVFAGSTHALPPTGCLGPGGSVGEPSQPQTFQMPVTVLPRDFDREAHPEHEAHGELGFDLFLQPGEERSHTFNLTGTFPYHDHFLPELRGTVIVEEQGPPGAQVRLVPEGYEPAEIRVGAGGVVTWRNDDSRPRTVSGDERHEEHMRPAMPRPGEEDGNAGQSAAGDPASQPPDRAAPGLGALGLGAGLLLACAAHGLHARGRGARCRTRGGPRGR